MVGLAGEGQNFDGNGLYVRFQPGGGDQTRRRSARRARATGELFGNDDRARRSARGRRYPGKRPPYKPDVPCYKQHDPERQRRRRGRRPTAPARDARARRGDEDGDPQALRATSWRSSASIVHRGAARRGGYILGQAAASRCPPGCRSSARTSSTQGRDVDRAGGHAGPGPDGATSPASRSARSRRSSSSDGKAVVDDEDPAASTRRSTTTRPSLLRPKTGLKDMVAELDAGHEAPRARLPEGGTIPVSPDAAGRQPRRDPRRRWTPTRATTCSCCSAARGQGLDGQGRAAVAHAPALRADRALRAPGQRRARARASANIARVVHNFSLLTDELGDKDDAARDASSRTPTRVFAHARRARTRACGRRCSSCRATLAGDADTTLGKAERARRRARADAAGACGPAPARSGRRCADAAVPARDDADHPDELRPFARAALPTVTRAAPGAARPRGRDAAT